MKRDIFREVEEEALLDKLAVQKDWLTSRVAEDKIDEIIKNHKEQLEQVGWSMHLNLEDWFEHRN